LLETVQCVILARDIEIEKSRFDVKQIEYFVLAKLATKVDTIREICASNHINILWISSKHDLAKAVDKWPIVSAIAILDYRGAEDAYSEAMHTLTNFMACCRIVEHTDQPSLLA
uniref:Ribosomal_L7Ae domain-containing protein n=1 Tax=Brugia timori TaxID=42155 RepID=A0A0R3QV64_9BILA